MKVSGWEEFFPGVIDGGAVGRVGGSLEDWADFERALGEPEMSQDAAIAIRNLLHPDRMICVASQTYQNALDKLVSEGIK